MRYVVYLDIYFLVNMLMDYIILFLAKRFIKQDTTFFRCFLGSVVGAGLSCVTLVVECVSGVVGMMVSYMLTVYAMNFATFRIRNITGSIKAIATTYGIAFMLGGLMNLIYYHTYAGVVIYRFMENIYSGNINIIRWIGMAMIAYGSIYFLVEVFVGRRKKVNRKYRVAIGYKNKEIDIMGLYDTGNVLKEPIDGIPVHIVSKNIGGCFDMTIEDEVRVVPYSGVGGMGILYSVKVDYMRVTDEYANVVYENRGERIAVGNSELSENNEFQIILNRSVLEME